MADLALARALASQLVAALADAVPPRSGSAIATPDTLDRALATSPPGAVLTLATSLVYPMPLVLRQPVTLRSEQRIAGRMTRDFPAPKFLGGLTVLGDDVVLDGLEVRHTRTDTTLVTIGAARVVLDRLRVLGDPASGAKRGIAANGNGDCAIQRCYVDDCFGPYPGDDTQAICAWDMGPGLLIEDCYLSGGSETLMIGGADPSNELRSPANITIRKNTITKNPAWMAKAVGVKNTLELKNASHVFIEDNDIEYSWGGKGQDGYLLMLTPRNQGGKAPFSNVEDVSITNNRIRHGAAAISLLGTDNVNTSRRMGRIAITKNTFSDLDPLLYKGSKRMILIQRGPEDVAITDNMFTGINLTSSVYFDGAPLCERLTVARNSWPKTAYGIFGTGATVGKAWDAFVLSGIVGPNTET